VNQTSGTTPAGAQPEAPDSSQPGGPEPAGASGGAWGFGARGRMRRRVRFLRKARELAYRDLGGLVFNLHRFGQRNDELVLNKLNTLGHLDAELRTLEVALEERETVTVLREAGITACPRCAAIHSGDDRFCPNCGLSMSRHVDLPIAAPPPAGAAPSPPATGASPSAPAAPSASGSASAAGSHASPGPRFAEAEPVTAAWPARSQAAPGESPAPESGTDSAGQPGVEGAPATGAPPPAPRGGRSPTPPARQSPTAGPVEGEQTEVLYPIEPDK
jgi:hypothetical protein